MKVAFLHSEYNGCALWRMFEPARFLANEGIEVLYFPEEKQLRGSVDSLAKKIKGADLMVSMRVDSMEQVALLLCIRHALKIPLVFETDDNFQSVDLLNVAAKHWKKDGDHYTAASMQMQESDIYQFSTFPLKQFFGYKYKKPTFVMPNLIDHEKWRSLRNPNHSDEIRMVWAGSATHYGDLAIVWPAIQELLNRNKKLRFISCGLQADFMFKDQDNKIMHDRVEFIEGSTFLDWPEKMAEQAADIAIAPLEDIRFNKDKSNCRYLEWSCLGVPGAYADIYPYAKTVTDGVNGIKFSVQTTGIKSEYHPRGVLVNSAARSFVEKIQPLIDSKTLREEIAGKAYENVVNNFSLQNNIGIWADNYKKMMELDVDLSDIDRAEEILQCRTQLLDSH